MKNQIIKYKDYDGSIITGNIIYTAFENRDKSIVWYCVDFGYKCFIIPKNEVITNTQLELF